jgi:hypothetical protein
VGRCFRRGKRRIAAETVDLTPPVYFVRIASRDRNTDFIGYTLDILIIGIYSVDDGG